MKLKLLTSSPRAFFFVLHSNICIFYRQFNIVIEDPDVMQNRFGF